MSDGRTDHPPPPLPAHPPTGPLILWLLIQLAALSLAALRIPLAAKYPRPEEMYATHVLLAAQVAASALLFPYLLRDAQASIAMIAAAWPFAAAAAGLSGLSLSRAAAGEAFVCTWLLALALWRGALQSERARLGAVAVAAMVSLGWAALGYLAIEFNPDMSAVGESGGQVSRFGPIGGALRQLSPNNAPLGDWLLLAAAATAGAAAALWTRTRRRDRLSTDRAPPVKNERPITS